MQIQDLTAKLDISRTTLHDWLKRYSDHFSPHAKRNRNRSFTQDDLDTLATIARLSHDSMKHDAIAEYLATGERDAFEDTTLGIDRRMVPAAVVEQIVDASELRNELERVKAERDKLLEIVATHQTAEQDLRTEIKVMHEKIEDLRQQLGEALGELNYRRKLDEKE